MFAHSRACFRRVENTLDFLFFKPYDVLVVIFGHSEFCRHVLIDSVVIVHILEKRADGRNFARFSFFRVGFFLAVEGIVRQIFHIRFEIAERDFVQILGGEVVNVFIVAKCAHVFEQIVEKYAQIVGVIQPRKGGRLRLDSHEKFLATFGQLISQCAKSVGDVFVAFAEIICHRI